MGIKIGEIDVASQIIENEYRILVLEKVVEVMLRKFPLVGPVISPQEMEQIRNSVVQVLQQKYPNSGISLKGENT